MELTMLKSKIHRAVVTQACLSYVGSITIDQKLMQASGILEYEKVQIVDINNGERFETYVIAGDPGSGIICLNGAAARCVQTGDLIIIMSYAVMTCEEAQMHQPKVVLVDEKNNISKIFRYEKKGYTKDMMLSQ
ncbi:MAG: aspartate 1-decarboxylase [Oscillospiraceae bacterium]|nr:aspartate 1-decarboxylase [Oscillospiraceae bacterium]